MSGSVRRSASGPGPHPHLDPVPGAGIVRPDLPEDSLATLQRLAGNQATTHVVQRLDDEDEASLLEAAKFVASPVGYVASKAGEWTGKQVKKKYDELMGEDGIGVEGVGDGVDLGDGGRVAWGRDDLVVSGGSDHVVGGAKGGAKGGAATEEPVGGDPLIGLRPGDGLDVGTWQRRPRVKLLQYRLNKAGGAELSVDGMWGKQTTAALETFQLASGIPPVRTLDAATSAALQGPAAGPTQAASASGGVPAALPDISTQVGPDVLARWEAPFVTQPGIALTAGRGAPPAGPTAAPVGASGTGTAGSLVGTPQGGSGMASGGGVGDGGSYASSMGIRTDPQTLARFEYYKPVLYDMWYRYERAADDTQAYFALLEQSAAAAGYWASRAFSSICASLAGIVLGPPGVALWTLANQFWALGARAAEEAERPILQAATGPTLETLIAFGNVVQQSFDMAYPMRTPDMPWYVVGSGWIQGPTSALINAYGQVQRLEH